MKNNKPNRGLSLWTRGLIYPYTTIVFNFREYPEAIVDGARSNYIIRKKSVLSILKKNHIPFEMNKDFDAGITIITKSIPTINKLRELFPNYKVQRHILSEDGDDDVLEVDYLGKVHHVKEELSVWTEGLLGKGYLFHIGLFEFYEKGLDDNFIMEKLISMLAKNNIKCYSYHSNGAGINFYADCSLDDISGFCNSYEGGPVIAKFSIMNIIKPMEIHGFMYSENKGIVF